MDSMIGMQDELTPEDMKRFLADHDGGELSICRHDFNGITSNGAVVMEPASRKLWLVHGPPCVGRWIELEVA
jgi:isopenicillin-N N-acyltransferase-like protein